MDDQLDRTLNPLSAAATNYHSYAPRPRHLELSSRINNRTTEDRERRTQVVHIFFVEPAYTEA